MPAVAAIEAIDPRLLAEPIDFIVAEHYRQRSALNLIEQTADATMAIEIRRRIAAMVLDFVRADLSLHVADEEHDLFPMLRRRCRPEDGFEAIVAQLAAEHADDEGLAREVVVGLEALAARPAAEPPSSFAVAARVFCRTQRRHLAWENATVLPLARARLTARDRRELARRMAARRGVRRPGSGS